MTQLQTKRFRLSPLVVLCLPIAILATGEARSADLVSRADVSRAAASGAGDSAAPIITSDGRFVVFVSDAGNLVTNDGNGASEVFLRDRLLGLTSLVSVSAGGISSANSASSSPGISSNGQFVVFQSRANNIVSNATNGWENIFVRDMNSEKTTLVSPGANGTAGDYASLNPQITPDGRYVVFESQADNLIENDTNRFSDVFVRDLNGSNTVLVSVNNSGNGSGLGYSVNPSITPDGRFVVFESNSPNLVTNDLNYTSDIFLRDLIAGSTALVSVDTNGTAGGTSQNAVISDTGRYVAFESAANYLVSEDDDGLNDIFLRDLQTGATTLVSPLPDFNVASNAPSRPVISRDGHLVAFQTGSATPLSVVTVGQVYVWDSQASTNILVSVGLDGTTPGNGVSHSPVISADSRYITFLSNATNLVVGATDGTFQVYQRDLAAGVTTLISVNRDGNGNNLDCSGVAASGDGRVVAFDSLDGYFVAGDLNDGYDVFVRDQSTNLIELVSARLKDLPSLTPNRMSSASWNSISADARFVVFTSLSDNLVSNDANQASDVFVRDLVNGTNLLVSVNTNGIAANGHSRNPVISADGGVVAFVSQATDLTAGVTNRTDQIYVRDLTAGVTVLASFNTNGAASAGTAGRPSISADGRFVAYETTANDIASLDYNNAPDVFVYDRETGTNLCASTVPSGSQTGSAASSNPVISPDGIPCLRERRPRLDHQRIHRGSGARLLARSCHLNNNPYQSAESGCEFGYRPPAHQPGWSQSCLHEHDEHIRI